MIISHKFEYGDKSLIPTIKHRKKDVFNNNNMIFEPVHSINNGIFKHWEDTLNKRGMPFAVFLVKDKYKSEDGYRYRYKFTMVTNTESIKELNNPPDSVGIVELDGSKP